MNICIIPARKGSKRIVKKNTKNFLGRPIIDYSIKAAKNSKIFDHIIVSSDSKKLLNYSTKYGADYSFLRDPKLSDDSAGILDVMHDAAKRIKRLFKNKVKYICCIFPASPLILSNDIKKAYKLIATNKFNYVFPATNYGHPVERSFKMTSQKKIKMLYPKNYIKNSQSFSKTFHDAGQFYFGTIESWMSKEKIFSKKSSIIKIPNWRVQDIDVPDDWKRAQFLFKNLNKSK